MSDTSKIEPALTPEEWARVSTVSDSRQLELHSPHGNKPTIVVPLSRAAKVVAVANDALRADDQRKITRKWIQTIRKAADRINWEWGDDGMDNAARELFAIAAAMESYLPPEGPPPLRVERGGLSEMPADLERKLNDSL